MDVNNLKAEASDWRSELQTDFREMIVNKMVDMLKNHIPFSGQKGLQELTKIAARFEEMYYTSARSQSDYLAKICLKMMTIAENAETSQNNMADSPQSTIASDSQGSQQLPPIPAVSHQSQASLFSFARPQDTNMQNMSTAIPYSAGSTSMGIRQHVVHPEEQPLRNRLLKRKLSHESIMQSFLPINLPDIHHQQQLKSQYISDFQKQQMVDIQHGSSRLESYQKPPTSHLSTDTALQQNRQQKEMQLGFQTPGSLLHLPSKSMIDQQIMLQSQGVSEVPLHSSSQAENAYGVDWEDEELKYISTEMYVPGLNEIFKEMSTNLSQENQVSSEIEPTNAHGMQGTTLHYDFTHNSSCLNDPRRMESTVACGNSNVEEQPLERLIKVVKSMSKKALNGSISDMSSVVSMVDRISESGPGNGSRAALGEDLVAQTKYHLQDSNLLAQEYGSICTKRMRRHTTSVPYNDISSA